MGQQELHIVLLSNDPQRAYPAFTLAMGARALGARTKIYATSGGLEVLRRGAAEKIQLPGMPPLNAIVQDAIKAGVEVCACGPSPEVLKQWGISPETIEPGVAIEDVMGFLDSALPAAQQGGIVTFI